MPCPAIGSGAPARRSPAYCRGCRCRRAAASGFSASSAPPRPVFWSAHTLRPGRIGEERRQASSRPRCRWLGEVGFDDVNGLAVARRVKLPSSETKVTFGRGCPRQGFGNGGQGHSMADARYEARVPIDVIVAEVGARGSENALMVWCSAPVVAVRADPEVRRAKRASERFRARCILPAHPRPKT